MKGGGALLHSNPFQIDSFELTRLALAVMVLCPKRGKPAKDSLRTLCLDVIERLIYSANDRSDRVNGCIYVLLALVIVNAEAALAMPSYYTMVTGDISNANYLDIPI